MRREKVRSKSEEEKKWRQIWRKWKKSWKKKKGKKLKKARLDPSFKEASAEATTNSAVNAMSSPELEYLQWKPLALILLQYEDLILSGRARSPRAIITYPLQEKRSTENSGTFLKPEFYILCRHYDRGKNPKPSYGDNKKSKDT